MFARLFLLFTIVPAVELYLLMQIGQLLGPLNTVLLIIITGAVGAALARREGFGVLQQIMADTQKGLPPADRLIEGVLVVVGGILLVTPGVLTDLSGFSLILPPTRRLLVGPVKAYFKKRITVMDGVDIGSPRPGPAARKRSETRDSFDHPTV